jgi:predicted SAM-dependent methyltransferase
MNARVINGYANDKNLSQIKLNLGCGGRPMKGWINLDNYDYEKNDSSRSGSIYDIKMDIRELDVDDTTVDEILLSHVIEHFVRWETIKMLKHYFNKLKHGGKIIVEMPDLDRCIAWYIRQKHTPSIKTPNGIMNMGLTQFYGNQWDELDYETHRYVWRLDEFTQVLQEIGFTIESASHQAVFHQKERDMFVIGVKL